MAVLSEYEVLTITATGPVPANVTKELFVKADGSLCGAGEAAAGISAYDADAGQELAIHAIGVFAVKAAAAIAVGDDVTSDANGKAVKWTPTAAVHNGTVTGGVLADLTVDLTMPAKNGRALTSCGSSGGTILVKIGL